MFGWNANQYQKFEAQRTLPAMDLARAIPLSMVKSCLDVGCGIGNSTAVLQQQFPEAQTVCFIFLQLLMWSFPMRAFSGFPSRIKY